MDIKGLRDGGLLVADPVSGAVAVISERGWCPVPSPLRELVFNALSVGEPDDAA